MFTLVKNTPANGEAPIVSDPTTSVKLRVTSVIRSIAVVAPTGLYSDLNIRKNFKNILAISYRVTEIYYALTMMKLPFESMHPRIYT